MSKGLVARAWSWQLTLSHSSPVVVACFLVVVLAKHHLHNVATCAFVRQQTVPSADVLTRAVKSKFIGRVLSARKSVEELAMFKARSSLIQRFAGPKPLKQDRQWFTCIRAQQMWARVAGAHGSARVLRRRRVGGASQTVC